MDTKFFAYPFAVAGNKTAVPNATQLDGSVSWQEGWGPDYQADPDGNPDAKLIPRSPFNQIMFDMSANLRQYQMQGFPQWATAADNGGVAVSYPINAFVVWNGGSGTDWTVYQSLIDGATAEPGTDPDEWAEFSSTAAIALLKANNLSDLTNVTAARSNLGLGSAALQSASYFATAASPVTTGIWGHDGATREVAKTLGALNIDWAVTDYPRKSITTASVITFSNFPGADIAQTLTLKLTLASGAIPTFTPGGGVTLKWLNDEEPEWSNGVWLVAFTAHGDGVARGAAGRFAG
jgi:hypothetical protein